MIITYVFGMLSDLHCTKDHSVAKASRNVPGGGVIEVIIYVYVDATYTVSGFDPRKRYLEHKCDVRSA